MKLAFFDIFMLSLLLFHALSHTFDETVWYVKYCSPDCTGQIYQIYEKNSKCYGTSGTAFRYVCQPNGDLHFNAYTGIPCQSKTSTNLVIPTGPSSPCTRNSDYSSERIYCNYTRPENWLTMHSYDSSQGCYAGSDPVGITHMQYDVCCQLNDTHWTQTPCGGEFHVHGNETCLEHSIHSSHSEEHSQCSLNADNVHVSFQLSEVCPFQEEIPYTVEITQTYSDITCVTNGIVKTGTAYYLALPSHLTHGMIWNFTDITQKRIKMEYTSSVYGDGSSIITVGCPTKDCDQYLGKNSGASATCGTRTNTLVGRLHRWPKCSDYKLNPCGENGHCGCPPGCTCNEDYFGEKCEYKYGSDLNPGSLMIGYEYYWLEPIIFRRQLETTDCSIVATPDLTFEGVVKKAQNDYITCTPEDDSGSKFYWKFDASSDFSSVTLTLYWRPDLSVPRTVVSSCTVVDIAGRCGGVIPKKEFGGVLQKCEYFSFGGLDRKGNLDYSIGGWPLCYGKYASVVGFEGQCSGHGVCYSLDKCVCNEGWDGDECEDGLVVPLPTGTPTTDSLDETNENKWYIPVLGVTSGGIFVAFCVCCSVCTLGVCLILVLLGGIVILVCGITVFLGLVASLGGTWRTVSMKKKERIPDDDGGEVEGGQGDPEFVGIDPDLGDLGGDGDDEVETRSLEREMKELEAFENDLEESGEVEEKRGEVVAVRRESVEENQF